ncbi:MAG TPA: beta-L-arabinofuranosidase domain-containing protein, partial [Actinoplanes sp.]
MAEATRRVQVPAGPVAPTAEAAGRLRPVPLGAVSITGGLWAARRAVNGEVAVPNGAKRLEAAGNLENLRIVAGTASGEARGPVFMDSDVYKWLEAAAWEYAREPSRQLLDTQREITAVVAAAQQPDGYLDSVVQLRNGGERYRDLVMGHEHYCAGHLFQAAVAQVRCTGDRGLLDVAIRLADHLVATFGPDRHQGLDGHPEVEMSLVELYRETGNRDYLELARHFVDARGRGTLEGHGYEPAYYSDRVPVREQTTVEGHAVRAVYLGAGAADVAAEMGDAELLQVLERQYATMDATKTYLTGGLGSRWDGESFGDPYELPPDRAYAETCAAVGGVQWAWRMLLATSDPRYADAAERKLFNGFLAGVSLTGTEYFYVNPLHLRSGAVPDEARSPAHGRRPWFRVACCPPNIMRTLASLPGYLATTDAEGLQLHQYAAGILTAAVPGGEARLSVETDYPWDGLIRVRVDETPEGEWTLSLRVPGWADGASLRVAGAEQPVAPGAYVAVCRSWQEGDTVELVLPMTVRVVEADERIDAIRGCVAVERGPLVYAVEQADLPDGVTVDDLRLDPAATTTAEFR